MAIAHPWCRLGHLHLDVERSPDRPTRLRDQLRGYRYDAVAFAVTAALPVKLFWAPICGALIV